MTSALLGCFTIGALAGGVVLSIVRRREAMSYSGRVAWAAVIMTAGFIGSSGFSALTAGLSDAAGWLCFATMFAGVISAYWLHRTVISSSPDR
jgi:hypothetical protein